MSWKLLLSTLLLSLLWAFVLSEENGIMGMVQTGVSFFAILFIMSYKNPLAEYNLFKSRVDQIKAGWHTTTDQITFSGYYAHVLHLQAFIWLMNFSMNQTGP